MMMRRTGLAITLAGATLVTGVAGMAQAEDHRERPGFAEIDTDGNGEISAEELAALGAARFAALDTDGNGTLSEAELIAEGLERAAARAAAMIERHDVNGDGELSADELPDRATHAFKRLDRDDSGTITAEEFERAREGRGDRRRPGGRHPGGEHGGHGGDDGDDAATR